MYFLRLLLYDVGIPEKKDVDIPKRKMSTYFKKNVNILSKNDNLVSDTVLFNNLISRIAITYT